MISQKPLFRFSFPSGHAAAVTAALSIMVFAYDSSPANRGSSLGRSPAALLLTCIYRGTLSRRHLDGEPAGGSGKLVMLATNSATYYALACRSWMVTASCLSIGLLIVSVLALVIGSIILYARYYV